MSQREIKSYRNVYIAIKNEDPNAFELYKKAVKTIDWSYMMSDDSRYYWGGVWQEKILKKLGNMLGEKGINYYESEREKYWADIEKKTKESDEYLSNFY
ncbi:MAG: hypothetical protein GF317_09810 [Candidatus Lokiarchaeota archaeon]|nr:hypothetical protein [Candidatus Lokiarchaeota archaeon]